MGRMMLSRLFSVIIWFSCYWGWVLRFIVSYSVLIVLGVLKFVFWVCRLLSFMVVYSGS